MKVWASILGAAVFGLVGTLAAAQSTGPAADKIDVNPTETAKTAPDQTLPAPQPDTAPPPAPADQTAKPAEAAPSGNTEPVSQNDALAIMGKKVVGQDGKEVLGSILDLLIGKDGKPVAAVIDFGGFLGVGSRHVAVDWDTLKFIPEEHSISIQLVMDAAAIKAAPEYKGANAETEVVEPDLPSVSPLAGATLPAEPVEPLPPLQPFKNAEQ